MVDNDPAAKEAARDQLFKLPGFVRASSEVSRDAPIACPHCGALLRATATVQAVVSPINLEAI